MNSGSYFPADGGLETFPSLDLVSAERYRISSESSLPIIYAVAAVYINSTIGPAYPHLVFPLSTLHVKPSNSH
jgi:hypothetical protein